MNETPHSLLQRLRQQPDEESWKRLIDLYSPLLHRWLRQAGLVGSDADDLIQEVFLTLVREMPSFDHNRRRGAFRSWLRKILVNRVRGFQRQRQHLPGLNLDPKFSETIERLEDDSSDLSRLWEREHNEFVVRRLLQLIEPEFTISTWEV
jgi:RNA polymerase sigma-70 factor (ECF subfamily)